MITGYSFRFAIESLRKELWINIMAALSAGIGLFLVGIVVLAVLNINLITKKLPEKLTIILYLKDRTSEEQIDRVIRSLKENSMIGSVKFISRDEALHELKNKLKDSSLLLEGLDENPLPDSVEIKLKQEHLEKDAINSLLQQLRSIPEVEDIDYGKDLMESIVLIKRLSDKLGAAFLLIMMAGIIFNFYTTIKILFYRRKEEIETFKLLGASRGFIKAPFLIEGAVIGLAGGLIASLAVTGLYQALNFLSEKMPFITTFNLQAQIFYFIIGLLFSGVILGITGAILSIGRIRY
ncbi:MAG: ABC transporter permease [Thermodesulfovibrionales bacterium]|nr:ABC transporter permease [Thermodesulfovibrionales bacterium]